MIPAPTAVAAPVWRIMIAEHAGTPLAGVRTSEGRFHHSGQPALYASLSAEGAGVAIQRYLAPDGPKRCIVELFVTSARIADLRRLPDPTRASIVWQDLRAQGARAPTWAFSDAARAAGAEGLLYPSRSRPDLTHLVLFRWGGTTGASVVPRGPIRPWPGPGCG